MRALQKQIAVNIFQDHLVIEDQKGLRAQKV